jgi:hypothetical protein
MSRPSRAHRLEGTTPSARLVSKKVKRRARRSRQRTKENLQTIRVFEESANSADGDPSVGTLHGLRTLRESVTGTSYFKKDPTYFRQDSRSNRRSRLVGSWQETTDAEKIIFGNRAIAKLGGQNAIAFSLNLSPEVEQKARSSPCWLRRTIVRLIGDLPMVLVFGLANGRLHLHGSVVMADGSSLRVVQEALGRAGGAWANQYGAVHQLVTKPLGSAGPVDRWGRYLFRNLCETGDVLASARWSMTNPARRVAKDLWEEVRRRANFAGSRTRR